MWKREEKKGQSWAKQLSTTFHIYKYWTIHFNFKSKLNNSEQNNFLAPVS